VRAVLVTGCHCIYRGHIHRRPRAPALLRGVVQVVEADSIVLGLVELMAAGVAEELEVSHRAVEEAVRLVWKTGVVVEARRRGREVLARESLTAAEEVPCPRACAKSAGAWAVSCQLAAAASASCLYSRRPTTASSLSVRRRRGSAAVGRLESAAQEGRLGASARTLVAAWALSCVMFLGLRDTACCSALRPS
jgi:hypothetical protein